MAKPPVRGFLRRTQSPRSPNGSREVHPVFPILGVFRLKGQSKRDSGIVVRSCKASQSPVYPIRDAILAVNTRAASRVLIPTSPVHYYSALYNRGQSSIVTLGYDVYANVTAITPRPLAPNARLRRVVLTRPRPLASTRPPGCHLTGTQYLGIISFMDCSMCTKPIPEPRLLVVPHTLIRSPECSGERIRWRSRERAKLQRQRRKAANAAKRQKA